MIGSGHLPFNGGPIITPTSCQPFNRISAIKRQHFVFNKKGGGTIVFRTKIPTNLRCVWRGHEITKSQNKCASQAHKQTRSIVDQSLQLQQSITWQGKRARQMPDQDEGGYRHKKRRRKRRRRKKRLARDLDWTRIYAACVARVRVLRISWLCVRP